MYIVIRTYILKYVYVYTDTVRMYVHIYTYYIVAIIQEVVSAKIHTQ